MKKSEKQGEIKLEITWLGQAGLLFETGKTKIIIDPYLSNSCQKVNPKSVRRYDVDESYLKIKPDVIILTHNHLDHTDPETLEHYLKNGGITVLASENAWQNVRTTGFENNYVMFNCGTEFTVNDITFKAVYAEHSDNRAIGVIFSAEEKNYYVTGDTLYSKKVFDSVKGKIDVVLLPINGKGNNMNSVDAKRFCEKLKVKKAVPLHFGLFDDLNGKEFEFNNKFVPTPFKKIEI